GGKQRPRPLLRARPCVRELQYRNQPPAALRQVFTGLPVAEQRGPKPERPLGSADRHEPVERLPEIVVLRVEPRQPERALRSREGSVALLRQRSEERRVGKECRCRWSP